MCRGYLQDNGGNHERTTYTQKKKQSFRVRPCGLPSKRLAVNMSKTVRSISSRALGEATVMLRDACKRDKDIKMVTTT